MKLIRLNNGRVAHVVARHSVETLCGYSPVNRRSGDNIFSPVSSDNPLPICAYCRESVSDLINTLALPAENRGAAVVVSGS